MLRIERTKYLQELIDRKHNGMVKVITGIRRCGKSFLLFTLFHDHLISQGVPKDHIITIELNQTVIVNQKMYRLLMKKYTSNASEIVCHFAA